MKPKNPREEERGRKSSPERREEPKKRIGNSGKSGKERKFRRTLSPEKRGKESEIRGRAEKIEKVSEEP
jgi:hypothetical protein